jgi:hypothetical protein
VAKEQGKQKSELEQLLVDTSEGDVDRILLEALSGRVALDKATGHILPRPGLYKLPQRGRLIVLLLARHALRILGLPGASSEAAPETLAAESQVQIKSCREYLSRLKSDGMVTKVDGGYQLPVWNILRAVDELKSGSGE